MQCFESIESLHEWRNSVSGTVALVPTMGYLHQGHEALLQAASDKADHVVMSIFVNPKQFNEANDYLHYPRDHDHDLAIANRHGLDAVWLPSVQTMYPQGDFWTLSHDFFEASLEGLYRPGHFQGVATVVMKLLGQVRADFLFLGEKDYQQYQWISQMVAEFFLPTEVIKVPTVREASGLAMSSRNARLKAKERLKASMLYQVLSQASDIHSGRKQLESEGFRVDYFEEVDGRRFVAAWLGDVRLIDTLALENKG